MTRRNEGLTLPEVEPLFPTMSPEDQAVLVGLTPGQSVRLSDGVMTLYGPDPLPRPIEFVLDLVISQRRRRQERRQKRR